MSDLKFSFFRMRAGASSLALRDYIVMDTQSFRAPLSLTMGWFFIRVLTTIPSDKFLEFQQHGLQFRAVDMIQTGWFKMYLDETQVAYARSTGYFSLIPVKQYEKPNFNLLKKQDRLLVQASKDWTPQGSARIVSKMSEGMFIVEGANPEQLFDDPHVGKIDEIPKVRPLRRLRL